MSSLFTLLCFSPKWFTSTVFCVAIFIKQLLLRFVLAFTGVGIVWVAVITVLLVISVWLYSVVFGCYRYLRDLNNSGKHYSCSYNRITRTWTTLNLGLSIQLLRFKITKLYKLHLRFYAPPLLEVIEIVYAPGAITRKNGNTFDTSVISALTNHLFFSDEL